MCKGSRRIDGCATCGKFDRITGPKTREELSRMIQRLTDKVPSFFDKMPLKDAWKADNFQIEASPEFINAVVEYVKEPKIDAASLGLLEGYYYFMGYTNKQFESLKICL